MTTFFTWSADNVTELYNLTRRTINDQRDAFFEKFGRAPRYVMVPDWMAEVVEREFEAARHATAAPTFFGLEMCPTPTINEISQIKVF